MIARDFFNRLDKMARNGLAALADELRSNARARLGLVAVSLVLLLALCLRVADFVASRNAQIAELSTKVRELKSLSSPEQAARWKTADAAFEKRISETRKLLWSNLPIGVAHADFYAWVQEAAQKAGLDGANLRLGDIRRIGKTGQVTEMRVQLVASGAQQPAVNQQSMHAFLKLVSNEPRLIVARSMRLRFIEPPLLEIELAAFVPTQEAKAPAQPAADALVLGGLGDEANVDGNRRR